MTKQEVISEFCTLSSRVGEHLNRRTARWSYARHLKERYAHDCFCEKLPFNETSIISSFQFDDEVIDFIVDAVNHAIAVNGEND